MNKDLKLKETCSMCPGNVERDCDKLCQYTPNCDMTCNTTVGIQWSTLIPVNG